MALTWGLNASSLSSRAPSLLAATIRFLLSVYSCIRHLLLGCISAHSELRLDPILPHFAQFGSCFSRFFVFCPTLLRIQRSAVAIRLYWNLQFLSERVGICAGSRGWRSNFGMCSTKQPSHTNLSTIRVQRHASSVYCKKSWFLCAEGEVRCKRRRLLCHRGVASTLLG